MNRAIHHAQHLLCPLCKSPLTCEENRKSLACSNNHTFDIAKQGYINLLPVQQKRSTQPGDGKDMVLARKQFLETGYYQPLADALSQQALNTLSTPSAAPVILDAGCGEGYYTERLYHALSASSCSPQVYAFDISKFAVTEAAKRSPDINWFVSTIKDIPLPHQSVDLLVSIFSPLQPDHFRQLLTPNGTLVTLSAGANHLKQLKELIYPDVTPYDPDKLIEQVAPEFKLQDRQSLQWTLSLSNIEHINALLSMTPHYWRASPEKKADLQTIKQLDVDVDVQLMVFKP